MATPSREGEVLDGKYRILRKLGEGGMGAVYAGENIRIKKTVAIKILHAAASSVGEMADRFEKEAQAAGQIGSEHIAEVHDLGMTPAGERYMVMEYLEGESFRARLKRLKKLHPADACALLVQVLDGLDGAHRAGIIHRDVKPDNVFVLREKAGRRDFVKVLDFGISKFTQSGDDGSMTKTGTVMGSPNYMSPEHVKASNEVDARSDIYSVGVMLFEAVTGHLPRKAGNYAEQLFKIVYEPIPDPRKFAPELSPDLVDIIMRACASDPAGRYQSAPGLQLALVDYMETHPNPAAVVPSPGSMTGSHSRGAALPGAPPSYGGASQPSFGGASQPSFGGASQPSFGPSQPSFGPSQPSFGPSQPSFGPSQPSFGPSQPSFGSASQPSVGGASQPSVGSGSQPSFIQGPQAGVATGAPFSVTQSQPARPGGRIALFAMGGAALLGVGVATTVFLLRPATAPSASAAVAAPIVTATSAAEPARAAESTASPTASVDDEKPPPSTSSAAAKPRPTAVTRPVGPAKPPVPQNTKPAAGY